jgi:phosphotriesterase-related protein
MKAVLLVLFLTLFLTGCSSENGRIIMTVGGPVPTGKMGVSLIHEHILVDFIGADLISAERWNKVKVAERVLPFLRQIKESGCQTFVECTPEYLGRDVLLLKSLSDRSGLNIITNTGYYGAANDKFLPKHAFDETAEQLSLRWIDEWKNGIDDTGIKPGFIKIGVDTGPLSEIDKKLIKAAALAHLQTGMSIASHTGPAVPAFEQLDILKQEGVAPEAFIWVHAQAEKDLSKHVKAAAMGTWIGLDGLNDNNTGDYVRMIKNLKDNQLLNKVLISHDAGWYHPGEENGGEFRGYSTLFVELVPLLEKEGFSKNEIRQLLVTNPSEAFTIRIRKSGAYPVK